MKSFYKILFILSIVFLSIGTCFAYDYKPYAFPFIGKWNPTDDPLLLDDYGFQDIQNMRRDGKHMKGIKGHVKINTNDISGNSSYYKPRSGAFFQKDYPIESHILIQAWNPTETSSKIYQNKTAVPNLGEFQSTVLHTDDADADIGKFSVAPSGNMAYANGQEALIWGGDEMKISGFYLKTYGQTPADNWEKVLTDDSGTYADLSGLTTFYVGANRRINKVKFYIKTANTTASTLSIYEYTLSDVTFVAVSGQSDGTSSGGKSLAITGTVSWTFNTDVRSTFVDDTDIPGYWYKFVLSTAASPGTAIYYVTAGESAFRPVEDIWDGVLIPPARVWYVTASGTTDFTTETTEDLYTSYADLETWSAANNSLVAGFTQKMRGLAFKFVSGHKNAAASGVTVDFHTGSIWSGVTGLYDGTKNGSATFANNEGWIHWIPTEETTEKNIESKRTYQSNESFYYYRVRVSDNLTDDAQLFFVEGIPAQPAQYTTKDTPGDASFPVSFQKRLFLFSGNQAVYSALDAPDVFNGEDSGKLIFSGQEKVIAAGVIFNLFLSTGIEQMIVTKASETLKLIGNGPENWVQEQIDPNVGNVARQSFAVCNVSDMQEGLKRNVAIWQASHGFVKSDGATVQDISDDIAVYFNSAKSQSIAKHRIDDTVGWFDPDNQEYHALISSGAETNDTWGDGDTWDNEPVESWGIDWESSITTHNLELVYSLKYNEWTKIYREDSQGAMPLQIGFQVKDTDGKLYTYGAADNGTLYSLENGRTWDGTPIAQYIHTKDLMLDNEKSIFNLTTIRNFRLMFVSKSAGSGETIQVTHYGDGVASVSGVSNQATISDIPMTATSGRSSQDVVLGDALKHSFRFDVSTSSVDEGMELLGMGLYYESYDGWRQ